MFINFQEFRLFVFMSFVKSHPKESTMPIILTIFGVLFISNYVENRKLISNKGVELDITKSSGVSDQVENNDNSFEKVLALKADNNEHEVYGIEKDKKLINERTKKPCSIIVLSNIQNSNMQSLLRKYRYDANGVLIPSSVKYFIKFPQGLRSSPLLVPLNDRAFSPLGGFVRYYKEVPPIPQSW